MAQVFLGSLMLVPYNFAPAGFAFCTGQNLSISANTALFALLGTTYGGNGTSNFNLPNLQGFHAIGQGQGPVTSNYTMGQTGGTATVTLQVPQGVAHQHTVNGSDVSSSQSTPVNDGLGKPAASIYSNATSPLVQMNSAAVSPAGGGGPHNNMMPYATLNWIIALTGIFPQRG